MKKIELSLKILFFTSLASLCFAYIGQYFFNLKPCILCLYQRIPFFVIIFVGFFALILKNNNFKKFAFYISLLVLVINIGIASYHVLVEKKVIEMTPKCLMNKTDFSSISELEKSLQEEPIARCDQPQFIFLGFSLASLNAIFCGLLLVLAIYFATMPNRNNKNN